MSIPSEISEWLLDKVERHRWSGVMESRTVTHQWMRSTGGMIMRAGLTVSIAPADAFTVTFPRDAASSSFIPAVRDGMFSVLLGLSYAPILKCAVVFETFSIHDTESNFVAFYSVSKEATERLLGLSEGYAHNIVW